MYKLIFHSCVTFLYGYTLWYDQNYVNFPFPSKEAEKMPFKSRIVFLTIWCMVSQTTYFFLALLSDISKALHRKSQTTRKIKEFLFPITFPFATYVFTVFWTLYFIDRDLIFPEALDKVYPKWVNHVMHTSILVFQIVEIFLSPTRFPTRLQGFSSLAFLASLYYFLIVYVYFKLNMWVYPFLNALILPYRILFFGSNLILILMVYVGCERVNNFFVSCRRGVKFE